jgi:hypothetical protein
VGPGQQRRLPFEQVGTRPRPQLGHNENTGALLALRGEGLGRVGVRGLAPIRHSMVRLYAVTPCFRRCQQHEQLPRSARFPATVLLGSY